MNDLITCQQVVSAILTEALVGDTPTYTEGGVIQWGKVEQAILETIEQHWPELEDDGK